MSLEGGRGGEGRGGEGRGGERGEGRGGREGGEGGEGGRGGREGGREGREGREEGVHSRITHSFFVASSAVGCPVHVFPFCCSLLVVVSFSSQ